MELNAFESLIVLIISMIGAGGVILVLLFLVWFILFYGISNYRGR
jgi:hypothetical protein